MANCYAIANPANGQTCNDDQLGRVYWNASDGTWEQLTDGEYQTDWANWTTGNNAVVKTIFGGQNNPGNSGGKGWTTIIMLALLGIGVYFLFFRK